MLLVLHFGQPQRGSTIRPLGAARLALHRAAMSHKLGRNDTSGSEAINALTR